MLKSLEENQIRIYVLALIIGATLGLYTLKLGLFLERFIEPALACAFVWNVCSDSFF